MSIIAKTAPNTSFPSGLGLGSQLHESVGKASGRHVEDDDEGKPPVTLRV